MSPVCKPFHSPTVPSRGFEPLASAFEARRTIRRAVRAFRSPPGIEPEGGRLPPLSLLQALPIRTLTSRLKVSW